MRITFVGAAGGVVSRLSPHAESTPMASRDAARSAPLVPTSFRAPGALGLLCSDIESRCLSFIRECCYLLTFRVHDPKSPADFARQ